MIQCKICNREFKSFISNSHLKTHNITSPEYRKLYGEVTSKEYKEKRSKMASGSNNPNYGKVHTLEAREKISKANSGKIAHNKGKPLSEEQKQLLSEKAIIRHQFYGHPSLGREVSPKTKNKISESIKRYAKDNPQELKNRAKKSVETKQKKGGYYEKRRRKTQQKYINLLSSWGYTGTYEKDIIIVLCNKCQSKFSRVAPGMLHEKMCNICHPSPSMSKDEIELLSWIRSVYDGEVIQSDKSVFGNGFEIDILLPDLNLGIEYNGLYWHSELQGKSNWYHRTKYEKANDVGIHLIQIFEDEWLHKKDIVKERLLAKIGKLNRTFARKCSIKQLNSREANEFLKRTHIQGVGYGSISYGLYYNEKLVAVMKFSKLNKAKGFVGIHDNVYELNRYASYGHIVGGASKLFSHFIRDYNPMSVVSYSDLRWNTGKVYEAIGMKYAGNTTPGYWYIQGTSRIHRFSLRKNKEDDQSLTEWENRKLQGWNRIWDCGHAKYVWTKEKGA